MRIEFTRDVGKSVRAGDVRDLADEVARLFIGQGHAREVAVPGVGPAASTDILVPDAVAHPAPESPGRPAPRPGATGDAPEAVGRGRLRQKEEGG